jgi:hypothetical protein
MDRIDAMRVHCRPGRGRPSTFEEHHDCISRLVRGRPRSIRWQEPEYVVVVPFAATSSMPSVKTFVATTCAIGTGVFVRAPLSDQLGLYLRGPQCRPCQTSIGADRVPDNDGFVSHQHALEVVPIVRKTHHCDGAAIAIVPHVQRTRAVQPPRRWRAASRWERIHPLSVEVAMKNRCSGYLYMGIARGQRHCSAI